MRDALGAVQSVLVLGGGSDIAAATCELLAQERCRTVILAGRSAERMTANAERIRSAGATTVELIDFDASAPETHAEVIDGVFSSHPDLDVVIIAFGVLGDQAELDRNPAVAAELASTNYAGGVDWHRSGRPPPPTGPRHPGVPVLGGGGTGPGRQLRVRLHQGGPRRLRPRVG